MVLNKEKGAGSWLTALPLKDHGYCLNKQEFRDAVSLRYGWRIANTAIFCACGKENSINHSQICLKGGFVNMRHNALRDLNAELQAEVCKDVAIEPGLIPVDNEEITGTRADGARTDISSRGLWGTFQRTFFDVRVLHPNCPSYLGKSITTLYQNHEHAKMVTYNSRIIPAYLIKKIQRVQNYAARIINRTTWEDSISKQLKELHWLPIKERIQYKVILFVFKALNNLAPTYLKRLLIHRNPVRTLRSSQQRLLYIKRFRTRYGKRAFSYIGPKLWNQLPLEMRTVDSLPNFKTLLKTYLFRKAYNQHT